MTVSAILTGIGIMLAISFVISVAFIAFAWWTK